MDWGEIQLAWRDKLLDTLTLVLARNQDTAALARRLHRYLENARAIEKQEAGGWDGARSARRMTEWTTERLKEIERARPESALLPLRIEWLTLTTVFRLAREERDEELDGPLSKPIHWLSIVEAEERELVGQFRGRQLTNAKRMEVIATERGAVRSPAEMALRLLYLVCRPSREDIQDFRRQLLRVKLAPPAL